MRIKWNENEYIYEIPNNKAIYAWIVLVAICGDRGSGLTCGQ